MPESLGGYLSETATLFLLPLFCYGLGYIYELECASLAGVPTDLVSLSRSRLSQVVLVAFGCVIFGVILGDAIGSLLRTEWSLGPRILLALLPTYLIAGYLAFRGPRVHFYDVCFAIAVSIWIVVVAVKYNKIIRMHEGIQPGLQETVRTFSEEERRVAAMPSNARKRAELKKWDELRDRVRDLERRNEEITRKRKVMFAGVLVGIVIAAGFFTQVAARAELELRTRYLTTSGPKRWLLFRTYGERSVLLSLSAQGKVGNQVRIIDGKDLGGLSLSWGDVAPIRDRQ